MGQNCHRSTGGMSSVMRFCTRTAFYSTLSSILSRKGTDVRPDHLTTLILRSVIVLVIGLVVAGGGGCDSGRHGDTQGMPGKACPYSKFVEGLTDPDRVCAVDSPSSELVSSADPQGGNNDYNNFLEALPNGWALLADLKGPGCMFRFWETGGNNNRQRFQFYFDDERTPRIDATVGELHRWGVPFMAPLSRHEQGSSWWSYVPLTYRRRLRITTDVSTAATRASRGCFTK